MARTNFTFDTKTMKQTVLTITIEPTMRYRLRVRLALIFFRIGARIAGIGSVKVAE